MGAGAWHRGGEAGDEVGNEYSDAEVTRRVDQVERRSQHTESSKPVHENHEFVVNRPQAAPQLPIRRLFVLTTPKISSCDKMRG